MIDTYVLGPTDERPVVLGGDAPPHHDEGAWLVFAHAGSHLNPDLARSLRTHAAARPDVAVFYADEAYGDRGGGGRTCKTAFDLTQLWTQNCVGLPLAVRASVLCEMGQPGPQNVEAAYDLVLRAAIGGRGVALVEEVWARVLVYIAPPDAATRRAILRALPSAPTAAFDLPLGRTSEVLQPVRRFPDPPPVTLMLQGVDELGATQLAQLAENLRTVQWSPDRLEIAAPAGAAARLRAKLGDETAVSALAPAVSFADAWRQATSEHIVFWRADLAPASPRWLEALMTYAVDENVGAVGARRLDAQGRIGHVGLVTVGPAVLAHPFAGLAADAPGFGNWAAVAREWSAVEGSVLACRRTVLEEANGFDSRVGAQLATPDLCLRLGLLGYRIVSTPAAEFAETSPPRTSVGSAEEIALFLERWSAYRGADPHWRRDLVSARGDVWPAQDPEAAWLSAK